MDDNSDSSETSDLGEMFGPEETIDLGNNDRYIFVEDIVLFAVDCIAYVMQWNNLSWDSPINTGYLRLFSRYKYFTPEIGKALVHHCMVEDVIITGLLVPFNIRRWLQLTDEEANVFIDEHLHEFLFILPPLHQNVFVHLYVWCFACQLCFRAVKQGRRNIVPHVISKLGNLMYNRFNTSDHYYNLRVTATRFNRAHEVLHSLSGDEGFRFNNDIVDNPAARYRDD